MSEPRIVRAPRGSRLSCKSWLTEAAYRMIQNNLDPDVAEKPMELVVYGGRAGRPKLGSLSMPSWIPCSSWKMMKPCWCNPVSLWWFSVAPGRAPCSDRQFKPGPALGYPGAFR